MITIHHNFDEKKFKWLWAKYVKAGNIVKYFALVVEECLDMLYPCKKGRVINGWIK